MNIGRKFRAVDDYKILMNRHIAIRQKDILVVKDENADFYLFDVFRFDKHIGEVNVEKIFYNIKFVLYDPSRNYNPRFPTDTVSIVGLYNGSWSIEFENRRSYDRKYLCCPLNTHTPEVFKHLNEAIDYAEDYNLTIVDVRHHRCIKDTWQVDDVMRERIKQFRSNKIVS